MIEVCETWEELLNWCGNKGIYCETNCWGDKTIIIEVPEYLECPLHKIEFKENDVLFDGKSLNFYITPTEKHHLIKMFYGR